MVQENGAFTDSETESIVRWSAGGLYAGAADTVCVNDTTSSQALMANSDSFRTNLVRDVDGHSSGNTGQRPAGN